MKVLIIGATGMLGRTLFRLYQNDKRYQVFGTVRDKELINTFPSEVKSAIISGVYCEYPNSLIQRLKEVRPDCVINCAGITKQLNQSKNPLVTIPVNALFPHQLASLCELINARLIHISTDCVFSGDKGNYKEEDFADASDLYGRSKFLGELNYSHSVTLRTSIIGHEYHTNSSLLEWFLSQKVKCNGFTRAIFSGLPTVVLGEIIRDYVFPNLNLTGLYHVAAEPISKYDLLKLIEKKYDKEIEIIPDHEFIVDRSLNADKFNSMTGFKAPSWPELIDKMHSFR